ncbi:YciI family protein [Nocardia sp. NPDC006630]|uniref:YciI family protein n=1 Tax=Nocardia sp. NPDC006630 TaxID=3157181 RepID=UPI0033B24359
MKAVVFYESADDLADKAPQHFAAHVAQYQPYIDRGDLLMIGTFADPQQNGSMAIFTTREAAEQFVANDPFVLHGVVKSYRILDWNEALAE